MHIFKKDKSWYTYINYKKVKNYFQMIGQVKALRSSSMTCI